MSINKQRTHRRTGVISTVVMLVVASYAVAGCGSDDKPSQPNQTAPVSVIDGRQGAGQDGANNNGNDTGDSVDVPQTTAHATADTQEKIGDQSPGGGDSNGLPSGSTP